MMNEAPKPVPLFGRALAITEKLLQSGYALLPLRPTAAMQEAGATAAGITREQAEQAYRAMHRVATEENGEEGQDPFVLIQELLKIQQLN